MILVEEWFWNFEYGDSGGLETVGVSNQQTFFTLSEGQLDTVLQICKMYERGEISEYVIFTFLPNGRTKSWVHSLEDPGG